ncbi:MAG TPA: enoyl-ACP reductase, partial [Planctomycetaceae bacterium]|nr:enoyl-ACP reductase [Planctomycetaceae bacterium]
FTHLPDKDPKYRRMERRLRKLVDPFAHFVLPCEVCSDRDLDAVFATARDTFGQIDFVLHSIAYAPTYDLKEPTYNVSRDGFLVAMEISVYNLLAIARRAKDVLKPGGSILTLTYLGGERVIPGYNLMGICKAALDRSVSYLAGELGPCGIRVNALSAGPVRTLSASAVGEFDLMMRLYQGMAPMRRNITPEEVGKAGMFLLSDLAGGITGEVLHVDAGYHAMGAPPPDFSFQE